MAEEALQARSEKNELTMKRYSYGHPRSEVGGDAERGEGGVRVVGQGTTSYES